MIVDVRFGPKTDSVHFKSFYPQIDLSILNDGTVINYRSEFSRTYAHDTFIHFTLSEYSAIKVALKAVDHEPIQAPVSEALVSVPNETSI